MRKRFDRQLALGQTPIEDVAIPAKSRDELPPVLAGLQWIFKVPEADRLLAIPTDSHPQWVKFQAHRADLLVRLQKDDNAKPVLEAALEDGELSELARLNFEGKMLERGEFPRGFKIITPCAWAHSDSWTRLCWQQAFSSRWAKPHLQSMRQSKR